MAADPSGFTPGIWLWDDPDHGGYTKFDDATSAQVDDKLKEAIRAKTKGPIEVALSAGPFFGLAKNEGVYACVLIVDCTNPEKPVINEARQTNTNSGYKRKIKRDPALDPPLAAHLQQIKDNLEGKWEWKDDYGWKQYDLETVNQIEDAYKAREPKVDMDQGSFFGKQRGIYYITFNYLSIPGSAQQHNKKSNYGRWVRRLPIKKDKSKLKHKQQELLLKKSPHMLVQKYYAPLSIEDFDDQMQDAKLKQNLKCSICLEEFEKKDLVESQKGDKASKKKVENTHNDEDEKGKGNHDVNKHRFLLTKAKGMVNNDSIVGLIACAYGHYFHAGCILPQLTSKKTCPNCMKVYGELTGHQPDGRLYVTRARQQCEGFVEKDSIKMLFEFPGGIQNEYHPNPGKIYFGDLREVWFPNNRGGREACMLVRLAHKRRLIFQIGTSLTLGQDNRIVFGSIHLKTQTKGGTDKHGYPDDTFFDRLKEELKVKGVTVDQLVKEDTDFIENGFPRTMELQ